MTEAHYQDQLPEIQALVMDVDGVFTDGSILLTESGEYLRQMSVRDGYALRQAIKAGIQVFIITGGNSIGVRDRFLALGAQEVHLEAHAKLPIMQDIATRRDLDLSRTIYIGDDILDIECIKAAGVGMCPSDAAPEVRASADIVLPIGGGKGCVRLLCEQVLKARNLW